MLSSSDLTIHLSDLVDGSKDDTNSPEGSAAPVGKKRVLSQEETDALTSKQSCWLEERGGRRAKKFRVEWMNEDYFKEWLRPHPTDETYCICIACDIRLRCGKSELEKHASGMKHCRRFDMMKEKQNNSSQLLSEGSQPDSSDRIVCEENGTLYVAPEVFNITGGDSAEAQVAAAAGSALSKALLKISEHVDKHLENISDYARRKLEMAEEEHIRRMQVLNKELELRSLEVLVKKRELQKLNGCLPMRKQGEPEPQAIIIHSLDDQFDAE